MEFYVEDNICSDIPDNSIVFKEYQDIPYFLARAATSNKEMMWEGNNTVSDEWATVETPDSVSYPKVDFLIFDRTKSTEPSDVLRKFVPPVAEMWSKFEILCKEDVGVIKMSMNLLLNNSKIQNSKFCPPLISRSQNTLTKIGGI